MPHQAPPRMNVGARTPPRGVPSVVMASAFLLGLLLFVGVGGHRVLNPLRSDWMSGDTAWQNLGWRYFRVEEWSLPPGDIRHFPEPLGTSVGHADAIPIVAVAGKLLNPYLPDNLQYLGVWLALSFGLQCLFGARITFLYSRSAIVALLGGLLFVLAPPFLWRTGHISLTAHWLLLAAFEFALDHRARPRRAIPILLIAAGVHPYLLAMAFVIALCRMLSSPAVTVAALALVILELDFFGYLGTAPQGADGWGHYSADMIALFDSMNRSLLVPAVATEASSSEGFQWLGFGVIIALPLVFLLTLTQRLARPNWGLICMCLVLWAYSLSNRITLAGREIFHFGFNYLGLGDVFQASGRFQWPLHYLILVGVVAGLGTSLRTKSYLLAGALGAIVALQASDQWNWRYDPGPPTHILSAPSWNLAQASYKHLVLYPPSLGCCAADPRLDPVQFGNLALKLGLTINSARLARNRCDDEQAYCDLLDSALRKGALDRETIYVVGGGNYLRNASCGSLDGFRVCVEASRNDPFSRSLTGG